VPYHSLIRPRVLAGCALALLAGCASYRAQPVDLAACRAAWQGRDPFAEPVSAYAKRLAEAGRPVRLDPADGLDLAEAEVVALVWNPALNAARRRAGIATAAAAEAGSWDDPAFSLDAKRVIGAATRPWMLVGALGVTVPLSGRLGLEAAHARTLDAVAREQLLGEESATLAVLRSRWLAWSAARERQQVTADFAAHARGLADIAERLRAAGELSVIAARALRIAALRAAARADEFAADAVIGELELRALVGLLPEAPCVLRPALALPADELARIAVLDPARAPALRLRLAEHQAAEARLRLEIRRQYPDLQLGFGYENDRGDRAVGPSLGFTIPLWNANRRAIAEAEAGRAASGAEVESAYAAALGDAAQARVVLAERTARLATLTTEVAPLVDAQLADSQRLAALGDLDVALLLEVLDAAWQFRLELVALRVDAAEAQNRLIAITGTPQAVPAPGGMP
jgi:cobalt-zinc-cadmium efflux system outer membrane protein